MRCRVCGKPVMTGVVLHEDCFKLCQPSPWRIVDVDPEPETHREVIEEDNFEYQVSDPVLCETVDGEHKIGRFDPSFGWFCEDGSCPKMARWMPIPD